MELLKKVEYIIVHHSQRSFDFPAFVKFRHESLREWEDCGYHFMIGSALFDEKPNVYPGRLEKYQGAHVKGYNDKSIGICVLGNFDQEHLTDTQLTLLTDLVCKKAKQYNVPTEKIMGHREFPEVTKTCPGKNIDMDFIRECVGPMIHDK